MLAFLSSGRQVEKKPPNMLIFIDLTCFLKPTQGTTQDKKCVCERTIAKLQNRGYQYRFFYINFYQKFIAAIRIVVHLFKLFSIIVIKPDSCG